MDSNSTGLQASRAGTKIDVNREQGTDLHFDLTKHESESFTKTTTAIFKSPTWRILHFQNLKTQTQRKELQRVLCSVAKDRQSRKWAGRPDTQWKSLPGFQADGRCSSTVLEEVKIIELQSEVLLKDQGLHQRNNHSSAAWMQGDDQPSQRALN